MYSIKRLSLLNVAFLSWIFLSGADCKKGKVSDNGGGGNNPPVVSDIEWWVTRADQGALLQKQTGALVFGTVANNNPFVDIDTTTQLQTIEGFGYTLTGGSAYLINHMDAAARAALLNELFSQADNSIRVSYLRISIGASDLDASVFSYDDLPSGQTDDPLTNFSLARDTVDLIPVLKQILLINPNINILGSPWSPPTWMKDNNNSKGGGLLAQYYDAYARYFVKYIQAMRANGININAITIQNEPQHGGNNPSMVMSALEQANFIKNNLGPAFQAASITTKIIVWDHNCNNPDYPITILNDPQARQYVDGSAFHLYEGQVTALSTVHNAFPDKNLYFTEQWTGANSSFEGDFKWHISNVIIGSMRNWSRIALEWNLASDPSWNPHTPGGCTECKGAITISGSTVTRNVAYYIIAQASKFVPPGSVRIGSNVINGLQTVAFKTPTGQKVLLVLNEGTSIIPFNIRFNGKWATSVISGGTAATYLWN